MGLKHKDQLSQNMVRLAALSVAVGMASAMTVERENELLKVGPSAQAPSCPQGTDREFNWYSCNLSGNGNKWFGVSYAKKTMQQALSECDNSSPKHRHAFLWISSFIVFKIIFIILIYTSPI